MAYMKPITDILMIDPLPRVDCSENAVLTGRWRPLYDAVPRGRPPITFDDVNASRDGRLLTSFLDSIKSTREDLTSWLEYDEDSKEEPMDIFEALLTVVKTDTETLLDIIMIELDSITEKIMNEALLQEELSSWRNSMSRYTLELEGMGRSLDGFHEFLVDYGASKKARSKLKHIHSRVKKTFAHAVSSYATMRAEMSILDSRRSIAEAESVGKLTELAFIFIPITFAASVFSMQIKELQNAVPLRSFIIACVITLACSYGLRLFVRSRLLRWSMQRLIEDVREYAEVQPNRPIPTGKFISFMLVKQRILHFVLASAIVAVPVIVPLWTNSNLDAGYKAAITVVLLVVVLLAALYATSEEEGSFERVWKRWARINFTTKRVRRSTVAEV
jgi:hypothetical protein